MDTESLKFDFDPIEGATKSIFPENAPKTAFKVDNEYIDYASLVPRDDGAIGVMLLVKPVYNAILMAIGKHIKRAFLQYYECRYFDKYPRFADYVEVYTDVIYFPIPKEEQNEIEIGVLLSVADVFMSSAHWACLAHLHPGEA